MQVQPSIQPGFADAVVQSQATFRCAMSAMSRPGRIVALAPRVEPPAPLSAPAAALLLTLCDFETTVWLDPTLSAAAAVADFLRFHTGARCIDDAAVANYAVISDSVRMPALATFAQGTPQYPDQSTTLIVEVERLAQSGWTLEGPGIRAASRLGAAPLPDDFAEQLGANRSRFPCGVDIFFTTRDEIAALPRSVRLTGTG